MIAVIGEELAVHLTAENEDEDAALDLLFRDADNLIVGRNWDGHVNLRMRKGSNKPVCTHHGYPLDGNRVCSRCEGY